MNRLRVLKGRVGRCEEVGVRKDGKGFRAYTLRFDGWESPILSYRQAVQLAARFSLPSKSIYVEIRQGSDVTKFIHYANGTIKKLNTL